MPICWKCKKPILEKDYPVISMVLGDINNPVAANKGQPMHSNCLKKDLNESAYTKEEKDLALKVIAEINEK